MANTPHRLFFALWPEDSARNVLTELMRSLQPKAPARWIRPENIHMTLAFLGDVETERLECLASIARAINSASFELELDQIEHWRKPQVICLTPSASSPILEKLATDLTARLRDGGFKWEQRPYRAHLTLARKAAHLPAQIQLERPVFWKSTGFVLVESIRDTHLPHYTVAQSWPLL